jgi:hypothetical protein
VITQFHLSSKQSIKQVHWQRPQIRQIWTVADRRSRAYRRSDHHDLSDRRARLAASYRRACRRDRVRCHRGPKLGSHLGDQVADHNGSARVLPDGLTRDMRQMSAFFGRGRRIFLYILVYHQPRRTGWPRRDRTAGRRRPVGGHGHQQRFACAGHLLALAPAYSPGRWHAAATWRPPVRSGTLMDSAARTSGGELWRSPVEMGHALARTAVYVERGGADDHRHDQPVAARPPG